MSTPTDLELCMAYKGDVATGAITQLRRALRLHADKGPVLIDSGLALVRRAIFAAYVDATVAGAGDEARELMRRVASLDEGALGSVVIKAPARKPAARKVRRA